MLSRLYWILVNMSANNLIRVYGQGRYGHRQTYRDCRGQEFMGTHKDAKTYFALLYPSMSIEVKHSPKKTR